ncbi:hypothetical protein [Streptomyces neyagawaensis]|uniref:hypothetical protein n=1 Tax=Streptomyces neyagawaensis TaxID=42238 RepID=UPI0006E1C2E3|nr:hypothetical protein [Streptomyces neyagawaensis]MCL6737526.1 hypothetical protein [Streptomyces neyagawaensis]MDE1687838.1 hypothetical protein [Streptomyces neyagawaensis]
MFEYEQRIRTEELIRDAETYRRARDARRAGREAARDARTTRRSASRPGPEEAEIEDHGTRHRARRFRLPRTA